MALLFMDGFDIYNSTTDLLNSSAWSRNSVTVNTFSASGGRFGGGALTGNADDQQWRISIPGGAVQGDTIFVNFAYFVPASPTTLDDPIFRASSTAGGRQMELRVTSTGDLQYRDANNALIATAVGGLNLNAWNWIGVQIIFGTTDANGTVIVEVNSIEVVNEVTQDTRHVANDPAFIEFLFTDLNDSFLDDVVIMDDAGIILNGLLADSRIQAALVDADGGVVAWTRNVGANDFEAVDDTLGTPDDDTTYVAATTAALETRFGMAALATSPQSIHAVQLKYRAKKSDVGNKTVRGLVNSNVTEALGNTVALVTSYRWYNDIFEQDPDTVAAWIEAGVNAAQFGVEIVA